MLRGARVNDMYYEDFHVGQRFASRSQVMTRERILAFGEEFDPQPQHTSEAAAAASNFGELIASGWHTAALTMRLLLSGEFKPAGGIVGAGMESLRWPLPVRPGDDLRVESEILEVRPSKSRPAQGLIKVRTSTFNQKNELVQEFVGNLVVPRRTPA